MGQANTSIQTFAPWAFSYVGATSLLGMLSIDTSKCKNPLSGFRLLPAPFRKGSWTLNFYGIAKNGRETKVTIPIRVDLP